MNREQIQSLVGEKEMQLDNIDYFLINSVPNVEQAGELGLLKVRLTVEIEALRAELNEVIPIDDSPASFTINGTEAASA